MLNYQRVFNIATENGPTYQHNPLQYRTAMADAAFQSSQSSIGWMEMLSVVPLARSYNDALS